MKLQGNKNVQIFNPDTKKLSPSQQTFSTNIQVSSIEDTTTYHNTYLKDHTSRREMKNHKLSTFAHKPCSSIKEG